MLFQEIKNRINPARVTTWYEKYERQISSSFLIGGFITDWLTLRRVDNLWENLWVSGHIVMIALFIILVHRIESKPSEDGSPNMKSFWFTNILQFFFGGILSAFLVFYFRSADLSTSWLFILILIVAFLANEGFRKHLTRLTFQLSMFFFSLFCFFIFIVPVFVHKIGIGIFVISGLLSLFTMILFLHVFVRFSGEKFYENRKIVSASILGIFFLINILYFTNLIPPIPISLKYSGVYHTVTKSENNTYTAKFEDFGWSGALQIYKVFHAVGGDTVYAYSSIFSPTSLDITVVHQWQYYDQTQKEWIGSGRINLPVVGGRDGGFRTYSTKSDVFPGLWRVNVLTQSGQVIGRLRFEVIQVQISPILQTKVLE